MGKKVLKFFLGYVWGKAGNSHSIHIVTALVASARSLYSVRGDMKESLKVNVTVGLLAMHLKSTFNSSQLEFKHKLTVRTEFR